MNTEVKRKRFTISKKTRQVLAILAVLIVLFVIMWAIEPKFAKARSIENMFKNILPVVLVGCSMTFVIISGNIDLSVGSLMSFSAVMFGFFAIWGINLWLAALLTVLIGVVVGMLNGVLTEILKIPAFISTMATYTAFGGLALSICDAVAVKGPGIKPITPLYRLKLFDAIPISVIIILVVVAIFIFLEKKTVLGKYAISIGGNQTAAKLAGINVAKIRIMFFMLSGAMAALSGVYLTSKTGSGSPLVGVGKEFDVISAVILGGINIKGGEGSIVRMLIGAGILMVLSSGMDMVGVHSYFQDVMKGIVLLIAILIEVAAKRNIK